MTRQEARQSARALFDVTQPQGQARPTLEALEAFLSLVREHDELRAALTSPFVPSEAKKGIIDRVCESLPATRMSRLLLHVLADHRAGEHLDVLVREFKVLVHRLERRVDAEVTTAVPLSEAQLAQLRDALAQATGQQVSLSARVDPAVIGGAVTRVGSVVYDGSLARQLARIKERFVTEG
jgi:F-type H+-transporting ATPase subunit delta